MLLGFCCVLLVKCIDRQNEEAEKKPLPSNVLALSSTVQFDAFSGTEKCMSCHKDLYQSHLATAHFRTSAPASEKTILGSFQQGTNEFVFSEHTRVRMEKRDSGFYQVAYVDGAEKVARRFDIVVGSGAKGQTSIYWHDGHLYQLPITYFSPAREWSNSPGFPMKATFNRAVTVRCLECHTSFVQSTAGVGGQPDSFDSSRIVYGVSCEKCHGPGARHVDYHQSHPEEKTAQFIVNTGRLSRQQQLDLCALCHGGRLEKTTPSFTFIAGDTLSNYFKVDSTSPDPNEIDLHGNQYGLLRASKCFRNSQALTCSSCHDSHKNERGQEAVFSQRCRQCHGGAHATAASCPMKARIGASINSNCIDCHMPAKPSKAIAVFLPGANQPLAALIHSHYISVYPAETEKFLAAKKSASHSR